MRFRRWIRIFAVVIILAGLAVVALHLHLRPEPMLRTEIYRGVYLTVEDAPGDPLGTGRLMIVEVHWDEPGVELGGRDFSFPVNPANPLDSHYRLTNADWALFRERASVLLNTTGYRPEAAYRSLPGLPVRSLETVVVGGKYSHVHQHSYLLYWDRRGNARLLMDKPPPPEALENAVLGIGLQGVPIAAGQARWEALYGRDILIPRTFIGIDPEKKILWLMAFENASGDFMIRRALMEGVLYGGMLDSGSATNLIIGPKAKDISSHTGIRHYRPLGAYLTVTAEPINQQGKEKP